MSHFLTARDQHNWDRFFFWRHLARRGGIDADTQLQVIPDLVKTESFESVIKLSGSPSHGPGQGRLNQAAAALEPGRVRLNTQRCDCADAKVTKGICLGEFTSKKI